MHPVFKQITEGIDIFDEEFERLYPEKWLKQADRHFTPVHIARKAVSFLTENGASKILDIGSGNGKFCMVGALTSPAHFTGVEYRKELCELATILATENQLKNTEFIHENILNITFSNYDAFYIFNPFLEHIDPTAIMDESVRNEKGSFDDYVHHVYNQFEQLPAGTRIASYWTRKEQFPDSYREVAIFFGNKLRLLEKK